MPKRLFVTVGGRRLWKALLSALVAVAALAILSEATIAYPAKVKNACRGDYLRFCPQYGEDSPQLKACMRSAGGNISRRCRDTLADFGYIPRKYHSSNLGK